MGPKHALICMLLAPMGAWGSACDIPDENGAHWRRAVSAVKYLPETEAWAGRMKNDKVVVQFVLSLDEPRIVDGRCYWPIEVRADGKPWRRYLVATVGGRVLQYRP